MQPPSRNRCHRFRALLLGAFLGAPALAQEPGPIQDNSFLLEEAYNQEPHIIQTIQTFTLGTTDSSWLYTLTQEWPVPGQRHQLSFTLQTLRLDREGSGATGVGDVAINYRYQLIGSGETKLAAAPRLTVLIPTGDADRGLGSGSWGVQAAFPLSVVWTGWLVTHTNVNGTYLPDVTSRTGSPGDSWVATLGQSVVWLPHPNVNLLVEGLFTRTWLSTKSGPAERADAAVISPGLRAAINLGSLQIVPGVAFPIGVGTSAGKNGVFFYLSFEHPIGGGAGS